MEIVHISKVLKVGNSLAIVIPSYVRLGMGIERGDYMIFAVYSNDILTARKMSPDELKQMKPEEIRY